MRTVEIDGKIVELPKGVYSLPNGKFRADYWSQEHNRNFYGGCTHNTIDEALESLKEAKKKAENYKPPVKVKPKNIEVQDYKGLKSEWTCRGCHKAYISVKQPDKCPNCGAIAFDWI